MDAEDKVNLLAHLIPRFGSGNPAQEDALEAFVTGMEPTFAYLRSRFPSWSARDIQLLGTELLASEVLKPGHSSRADFAKWLAALSDGEFLSILEDRKKPRATAAAELKEYKSAMEEYERKQKEEQEELKAQIETARENRAIEFNIRTGKFEVVEKKK
jgi:hypothetical protein